MRKLFLLTAILFLSCSKDDAVVNHLNANIDNLEGQLVRMYRVNQKLTAEKDALLIEIDAKVAEIAALNSFSDSLLIDNGLLKSRVAKLLSDIDVLNGEVSSLNEDLDAANEVIVGLNDANANLEYEVNRLELINYNAQNTIDELNAKIAGLESENAILAAHIEGQLARIKHLRKRRDLFKAKLAAARNSNDSLQSDIDALESEVDQLNAKVKQLEDTVEGRVHQAIYGLEQILKECGSRNSKPCRVARDWHKYFADIYVNNNGGTVWN